MDRRFAWAIMLIMVIALAPTFLFKRPPARNAPAVGAADTVLPADSGATAPTAQAPAMQATPPDSNLATGDYQPAEQLVTVSAPLYTWRISTRGARLVGAELNEYRTLAKGDSGNVQLIRPGDGLFGLALVNGRDTIDFRDWTFEPSATALTVDGPTPLTLSAQRGGTSVQLTYTFHPDYQVEVAGTVTPLAPQGASLLVSLGSGLHNAETDSSLNFRSYAIVTMAGGVDRTDFRAFDPGETKVLNGPFAWTAIKSMYFVASLFAVDSAGQSPRISGVTATAPVMAGKDPNTVITAAVLPVPASGTFSWRSYIGPMEYDRLTSLGHEFDDVNPYGWPGFRTMVQFFAVPVRWLLVQMHEQLNLAYGVVLVLFGILVRVLLWPLNQKAMRANMKMQEIQPHLKSAQERYKEQPALLQQEMFRLYKEHGANPLSGCWPMLLPMPVLFALFFVFQNAIELRGQSFLWLPDLARADPLYIIPVVMGLSMFVLSKVGQLGMEPNPQMKMMLYVMPVMMTVFFVNLASGLNLYYAVSNIASIPQQWMLSRERRKKVAAAIVNVKTRSGK
ncbi:MAG TPA: membrane protein insertase YidC [Gemmatimonadales bacterium]|nr:membrane protein insertase YidC [Gemmatimonadales bacterium]